jgi:hypothetical protein
MRSHPSGEKLRSASGGHRRSLPFASCDRLFQIEGIPEDDRGDNQIEPTGLVLQILAEPITNCAAAVEENRRADEFVPRLCSVLNEPDAGVTQALRAVCRQ